MTTDEKAINYALMSQYRQQLEDERQERRETRRTWVEAGAAIALGLIGLAIWSVSMGVAHVG